MSNRHLSCQPIGRLTLTDTVAYLTDRRLQDGVEPPLRGVQVSRDPLVLQFLSEGGGVARQLDGVLEGEGRVAVGPRLFQPGRGQGGVHLIGRKAVCLC